MTQLHAIQTVGSLGERAGGPSRTVTALCAALTHTEIEIDLVSGTLGDGDAQVLPPPGRMRPLFVHGQRNFGATIDLARARLPDVPVLIHDNGIWATSNRAVVAAARQRGLRYVISPHGMLDPWALAYHAYRKKLAWWAYQRAALAGAAGLLATAEHERVAIRALLPHMPVAVITNGVDSAAVAPPTDAGSTTVLFMSRIHHVKNLLGLIDAWAMIVAQPQFGAWRLVIAGTDENGHRAEVMRYAEKRGVQGRVDFLGPIGNGEKAAMFARAALLVLPSFTENFGIVVAEALAAGLPVIATHGAPWGELPERRAGWWVAPAPAPLAAALGAALSLPPEERRAMGVRGHAWVSAAFGWERIAADTADYYRWVMFGGRPPEFVDA